MTFKINRLDHLVLPVRDIPETCAFYEKVLGMETVTFGDNRTALAFGEQKINLHPAGWAYEPKAANPVAGSGDLCFITTTPIQQVIAHLNACGVAIEVGPVRRTGARSQLESVYIRDPDQNLIEISNETT